MSFATSRVFKASRALLAPAKSAAAAAASSKPSSSASATIAPSKSKSKPPTKKSAPPGLLKPYPVSPALRDFLGVPESSRPDAVKQVWAHIKKHNLQNPTNKREIFCDEKLKPIFDGKDKIGFLEIGKLLARHFMKTG